MRKPISTTLLAFDFGESRIGVAVGDAVIRIAHPVATLHVSTNVDRLAAVGKLVDEWHPAAFVIGEPHYEDPRTDADGKILAHPIALLAKKFGNRLHEKFRLPVFYVNEFLTSHEAGATLRAQGITGRAQKDELDAAAAQVILQSYFNSAVAAIGNQEERNQNAA